jgi:hypothetical protein
VQKFDDLSKGVPTNVKFYEIALTVAKEGKEGAQN